MFFRLTAAQIRVFFKCLGILRHHHIGTFRHVLFLIFYIHRCLINCHERFDILILLHGIHHFLFFFCCGLILQYDLCMVRQQVIVLNGSDGTDRILKSESHKQKSHTAADTQHCHEKPLFIPEQIAHCGFVRKA